MAVSLELIVFTILAFLPILGYKDPEITEEYELVSISDGSEEESFYISILSDNTYTYRYKLDDSDNYIIGSLSGSNHNIKEVEKDKCTTPEVVVYTQKPKYMLWLTLGYDKVKVSYVFVVPKGGIIKQN